MRAKISTIVLIAIIITNTSPLPGISAISQAVDFANKMYTLFDATCTIEGYKRANNINIKNLRIGATLKSRGFYQQNGKIFKHGAYEIEFNQTTSWYFTKSSMTATGSDGVSVWEVKDGIIDHSIIIFYKNPWNQFNYAGICVRNIDYSGLDKDSPLAQAQLKQIYKELHEHHLKYGNWPQQCLLSDNTITKQVPFFRKYPISLLYSGGMIVKYEFIDMTGPNDCYIQQLDIVIS